MVLYLTVLHPSVKSAPFHRGEGMIMGVCTCASYTPVYRNAPFYRGEGKMMMMMMMMMLCVCVDIARGMYLRVLHVLMVCSLCYPWLPTLGGAPCAKLAPVYVHQVCERRVGVSRGLKCAFGRFSQKPCCPGGPADVSSAESECCSGRCVLAVLIA